MRKCVHVSYCPNLLFWDLKTLAIPVAHLVGSSPPRPNLLPFFSMIQFTQINDRPLGYHLKDFSYPIQYLIAICFRAFECDFELCSKLLCKVSEMDPATSR
jgi:hypothetical protein